MPGNNATGRLGVPERERFVAGFCDCAGLSSPRAGAGRTSGARNVHPTVKPLALMRWLVRLVTPPGGLVLDPFAGSGTTGIACIQEQLRFIGIEREAEYVQIAEARIAATAERYETGGPLFAAVDLGGVLPP